MPSTREALDVGFAERQDAMRQVIRETQPEEVMQALASLAEAIRDVTAPDDLKDLDSKLHCILRDDGLIPGDDEPAND